MLLLTCATLGVTFHTIWLIVLKRDYPLWIGIPIALISQGVFVLAANFQWDRASATTYLQNEALPATISLAIVTTALVVSLRANTSARDKRHRQEAELASAQDKLKFLNAQINPPFS